MKQAAVAALLALAACQGPGELKKKMRNDACTRNLDCAYGLECVDGAAPADGGVGVKGRTCQFQSFGRTSPLRTFVDGTPIAFARSIRARIRGT